MQQVIVVLVSALEGDDRTVLSLADSLLKAQLRLRACLADKG
jgi:hypothetical protein